MEKEQEAEKKELIQRINAANVTRVEELEEGFSSHVPKYLRIFPKEFSLFSTDHKYDPTGKNKKVFEKTKGAEKKGVEEIISGNTYYGILLIRLFEKTC